MLICSLQTKEIPGSHLTEKLKTLVYFFVNLLYYLNNHYDIIVPWANLKIIFVSPYPTLFNGVGGLENYFLNFSNLIPI